MERNEIEAIIRKYNLSDNGDGTVRIAFEKGHKPTENDMATIRAAKPEVFAYWTQIKAEKEERQRRINAIEGLKEIKEARAEWSNYHYKFNQAMDRGDCRFPEKPQSDPETLAVKYQRAAAYLQADKYSDSSNYAKADAGKKALERIINGEDHEMVIAEMEAEWKAAAHEAVMNN